MSVCKAYPLHAHFLISSVVDWHSYSVGVCVCACVCVCVCVCVFADCVGESGLYEAMEECGSEPSSCDRLLSSCITGVIFNPAFPVSCPPTTVS